ncbi:MAG: polyribonucleotide nucleotidyltransferase [bacterium]|nr:polyribonucleotide nucleotidyltransferase [bacterium]
MLKSLFKDRTSSSEQVSSEENGKKEEKNMNENVITHVIAGREVTIETGQIARQANGSVVVRCGDAVLLATAVASKAPKEGIDFFPLTVEYIEKMYASGKIPGGFFKRETRPSTTATLTARLIDRPIRPSFPGEYKNDVQVVVTVLSHDQNVMPEPLAIVAASAALTVSDIPFIGPVGAALVCEVNGELVVNPPLEQVQEATLEIVVAGTKDAVLMIEAGASEVSEARIIESIQLAHRTIKETVALQEQLRQKFGKQKLEFVAPAIDGELKSKIEGILGNRIEDNMQSGSKKEIEDFLSDLESEVLSTCVAEDKSNEAEVKRIYGKVKKAQIRDIIITKQIRPDGRKTNEIRPISIGLGLLPSAHGSALFTRGETQSLGVVTLGTGSDEQIDDGLNETKRSSYYFHYNFPPYSVGETGFLGRTGRRELGHGALAQRALKSVLPVHSDFPYTIRIVSEILESNGSSSMASVCSGSLSLMDCGAPIKAPVSGIAMGLLLDDQGKYSILSDIQGLEDHYGDMDFKVAGTKDGITALQLDIKVSGLSEEILKEALAQANEGRMHILGKMNEVIEKPRDQVAANAPKIGFINIDPEKVGMLIGPGGKNIKSIEEATSATVYVVDGATGEVSVSADNQASLDKALNMITLMLKEVEVGDQLDATVVKVVNFGAFVNLTGTGKDALLHISKIAKERVENVEDYLKVGDALNVKVDEVANGKISVSRVLN